MTGLHGMPCGCPVGTAGVVHVWTCQYAPENYRLPDPTTSAANAGCGECDRLRALADSWQAAHADAIGQRDEQAQEAKQAWAEAKGYRDAIDTEIDRRQYVEAELRDAFALLMDMRDSMYVRPYRARIDAFMERYAKGDVRNVNE